MITIFLIFVIRHFGVRLSAYEGITCTNCYDGAVISRRTAFIIGVFTVFRFIIGGSFVSGIGVISCVGLGSVGLSLSSIPVPRVTIWIAHCSHYI